MPEADSVVEARGIVVPGQTAAVVPSTKRWREAYSREEYPLKAKTLEQRYVLSHPFDELLRVVATRRLTTEEYRYRRAIRPAKGVELGWRLLSVQPSCTGKMEAVIWGDRS